jgi:prophage DNA circulation protein
MSQISDIRNPWRAILLSRPASFRGLVFHVESNGVTSGRRVVVHEYPKRNDPYSEDMGRHARRVQFSGYLIYRPSNPVYVYTDQRQNLYRALEQDDAGNLIHPVICPGGWLAMCERFTMTESRERGGYTQFEMAFVEAGKFVSSQGVSLNTASNVAIKATEAEQLAQGMIPL